MPMTDDLSKRIDVVELKLDEGFRKVDSRFAQVDERFAQVDHRFDQIDQRFAQVDQKFAQVDQKFARVDQRFDALEAKMDGRFLDVERGLDDVRKWSEYLADRNARDIAALREDTRAGFAAVERRFDRLEERLFRDRQDPF